MVSDPLKRGDTFMTNLGPRRNVYVKDTGYFQKDNRRYLCVVLNRRIQRYFDSMGRSRSRLRIELKVVKV
jgi:hypothetical protein